MRLHQTPLSEIDRAKTLTTLLAPMGLIVYGSAMPFLLLQFYVIPYQVGSGEILPDGSVNWATMEAWISLTVFALHVPLALMAMRVIWNRYSPQSRSNLRILRRARSKDDSRLPF